MKAKHERLFRRPYTYRGSLIITFALCTLLAVTAAFFCSFDFTRSRVRAEITSDQSNAAAALSALASETDLSPDRLASALSNERVAIVYLGETAAELTEEETADLLESGTLLKTRAREKQPVTYLLTADGIYRLSLPEGTNLSRVTGLRLVFSFAVVLVMIALVILYTARRVSRPVSNLSAAMSAVADGDFSPRLPEDEPGEIGDLMRDFNDMAESLGRTEYIQKDFIGSISHEFKTPIASIRGYARLLKTPGLDEQTRQDYVRTIDRESERLSGMSQTLLRLASLEQQNQAAPARVSRFSLDEQLRQTVVNLTPLWEAKNIDWALDLPETFIETDADLLEQVWVNLLQNAIKFSDSGQEIAIRIAAKDGITVEVEDHGIGMDAETRKHVFDRFFQADPSRSGGGAGLGLTLSKRIVDILGGVIRVESELGRGSTFRVILPMVYGEEATAWQKRTTGRTSAGRA